MNWVVSELLNYPTLDDVEKDFNDLATRWRTMLPLSCIGNLTVDYFTLDERLHTKVKSNTSFYDFLYNFSTWNEKPGVRRIFEEAPYSSYVKRVMSSYKMYIGTCTIFKPLQTLRILDMITCKVAMLDPTAGWGGRLVGACIKNVPEYIGIDSNRELEHPYSRLTAFLKDKTHTKVTMHWGDATAFDYSQMKYDLVLTSPPYFNIEKYRGMKEYATRRQWIDEFYRPTFMRIFESLADGGTMALNLNETLYIFFVGMFGKETFRIPMITRGRNQKYSEFVYVWYKKQSDI
jgi:hypothetical protein